MGGGAAAALGAAGIAAAALGSRSWTARDLWFRLTGAEGELGALPPRGDMTYEYGTLRSTHVRELVEYGIATPPALAGGQGGAGGPAPLCVCLPGRGRGPRDVLEEPGRMGDYAAQAFAGGVSPFVLVAVRGGDTYWHRRVSGEDAMAMLFEEFLPFCRDELRRAGAAGTAVMGWSMGGYGALRAAELHPRRFRGVCAVSAALWRSFADGVGDAFDGAADYAANDVFAGADRLDSLPVRLDCGEQDPFYEANVAFAAALPELPAGGFSPGGHDDAYWHRVTPAEIDSSGGSWRRGEVVRRAAGRRARRALVPALPWPIVMPVPTITSLPSLLDWCRRGRRPRRGAGEARR